METRVRGTRNTMHKIRNFLIICIYGGIEPILRLCVRACTKATQLDLTRLINIEIENTKSIEHTGYLCATILYNKQPKRSQASALGIT